MINNITTTYSDNDTQKLGEGFAKYVSPGDVVYLQGNLGSGKTTFVKGLAKGLGIVSRIISPTFIIVRQHETGKEGKERGIEYIYHIDLYRLEEQKEVLGIDIQGLLNDKRAVTLIEWPELAGDILSQNGWKIIFEYLNDSERRISIKQYE